MDIFLLVLSCVWRESKVYICGFEPGPQIFSQCMTAYMGSCVLIKKQAQSNNVW